MNYQRAYEKQKELIDNIKCSYPDWDIIEQLESELQAIEAEEEAQPELIVPSEEDIEKYCNDIANPTSKNVFQRGEWVGVKEGAIWSISEIKKLNEK